MLAAPYLSIVTPVYGCAEALVELCQRLHVVLGEISPNYEILMVNDASPDNSWEIIQSLAAEDRRVKGINLSRNFGQHYAITAGLDFAHGKWVVVMDCDLQDVPEEIANFHSVALMGYDIVVGRRADRKDSCLKRMFSKAYARTLSYLSGVNVDPAVANFGIYSKKVISSIRQLREQNRSFGLFALWVGFERVAIDVTHSPRAYGRSSYTLRKMLALCFDSVIAHSDRLLKLTVKMGFAITTVSFFYAVWLVIKYLLSSAPFTGWTSVIVSVYFTSGIIISSVGVAGLYIGKVFDEVKGRPLYFIRETTFNKETD